MDDHAGPEPAPAARDLSELIGSRICHDLTSPLGAIGNGVDLLGLTGASPGGAVELELIRDSVAQAQARVRLLRLAFGAAGPGQQLGAAEIARLVLDMARGGRLRIDWPAPAALPRAEVKLLVLLVLCLGSALPQGGDITLRRDGADAVLTGQGPRLRDLAGEWRRFDPMAQAAPPTAPLVHFAVAAQTAAVLRRRVVVEAGSDGLRLTVLG